MLKLGDFENLKHMLGISNDRDKRIWGYRNYFATSIGSEEEESMERLAQAGLVKKLQDENYSMYVATFEGAKVAGLSRNKMRELNIVRSE